MTQEEATIFFVLMLAAITPVAVLMPSYCINVYDRHVNVFGMWALNIGLGIPMFVASTTATWTDFWNVVTLDVSTPGEAYGALIISVAATFHVMLTFVIVGALQRLRRRVEAATP